MLHIIHLIQRRRAGRPLGILLPILLVSAVGLLAGVTLLMSR